MNERRPPSNWFYAAMFAFSILAGWISTTSQNLFTNAILIGGLGLLGLTFYRSELLMHFFLILPVVEIAQRLPVGERFSSIIMYIVVIVIGVALLYGLIKKRDPFNLHPDAHSLLIFAYIMFVLFEVANPEEDPEVWWGGFRVLGGGATLYFITRFLMDSHEKMVRFWFGMQISAAAVSLYGYYQKFVGLNAFDSVWVQRLGSAYVNGVDLRIFSTMNNSFEMAMFLGVTIIIGFRLLNMTNNRTIRIVTMITLGINLFGITMTLVRGSWVALGLAMTVQIVMRLSLKTVRNVLLFAVAVALLLQVFPLPDSFVDRLTSISDGGDDYAVQDRMNTWNKLFVIIGDHPLFGMGIGTTGGISQYYAQFGLTPYVASDNQFISMLYETGYPGAGLFVSIMLLSLLRGCFVTWFGKNEIEKQKAMMFTGTQVFFAMSFVSNNVLILFPIYFLYWILLGMQYQGTAQLQSALQDERGKAL